MFKLVHVKAQMTKKGSNDQSFDSAWPLNPFSFPLVTKVSQLIAQKTTTYVPDNEQGIRGLSRRNFHDIQQWNATRKQASGPDRLVCLLPCDFSAEDPYVDHSTYFAWCETNQLDGQQKIVEWWIKEVKLPMYFSWSRKSAAHVHNFSYLRSTVCWRMQGNIAL